LDRSFLAVLISNSIPRSPHFRSRRTVTNSQCVRHDGFEVAAGDGQTPSPPPSRLQLSRPPCACLSRVIALGSINSLHIGCNGPEDLNSAEPIAFGVETDSSPTFIANHLAYNLNLLPRSRPNSS
jgi:hypothetical protein